MATAASNSGQGPQARVAVVAVHGVADQPPFDSARRVARLLVNIDRQAGHTRYTPLVESPVWVATRKLDVSNAPMHTNATEHSTRDVSRAAQADVRFSCELLARYEAPGPEGTYETVRLSTCRLDDDGNPERDVHVYEMYWADLSRLSGGLLRILGELYQLMFHASNLGRQTVDLAVSEEFGEHRRWRVLRRLYTWAGYTLVLPVMLLNMFIVGAALCAVPAALPESARLIASLCLLSLIGGVVAGHVVFRHITDVRGFFWAAAPYSFAGALLSIIWLIYYWGLELVGGFSDVRLLTLETLAIAAGVCGWLVYRYERRRPHAIVWGLALGVPAAILLGGAILFAEPSSQGMIAAVLLGVEVLVAAAFLSWGALILLASAAWSLSMWCILRTPDKDGARERAKAVARTSRIAIGIPMAVISVVTVVLWSLMVRGLGAIFSDDILSDTWYTSRVLTYIYGEEWPTVTAGAFIDTLVSESATNVFAGVLILLGMAILIAAWGLLPSVIAEVRCPHGDGADAKRYGRWLDRGQRSLEVASDFVFAAVVGLVAAGLAARFTGWKLPVFIETRALVGTMTTLIAGSATGLLIFRGRLQNLALGFRPVLDVALDVGNHLRKRPEDQTPRAAMFARYTSLLRYLYNWQHPVDQKGYDAIVIIAHSQGTVLTVDLFRLLSHLGFDQAGLEAFDSRSATSAQRTPVRLFTMGCPLRQLYRRRFPHLYGFVAVDDESASLVSPRQLGFDCWTNSYRSGDYVGRDLWGNEHPTHPFECASTKGQPQAGWVAGAMRVPDTVGLTDDATSRREFCIGPGAHNHYWDVHAAPIAMELDRLITLPPFQLKHPQAVAQQTVPALDHPRQELPISRPTTHAPRKP